MIKLFLQPDFSQLKTSSHIDLSPFIINHLDRLSGSSHSLTTAHITDGDTEEGKTGQEYTLKHEHTHTHNQMTATAFACSGENKWDTLPLLVSVSC